MDTQTLLDKYKPLLKRHWLPLLLATLGLIFFVYGLIGLGGSSQPQEEITFESGNEQKDTDKEFSQKIFIDVEGAVIKPGVYGLSADSRIQEALVVAGGMSENADREWVAKNLNLALKVKDGTKIYIPDKTQSSNLKVQNYNGEDLDQSNIININIATAEELDGLPGVGLVTAQKIIDGRPYNSIEELLGNKVVSNSVFEKIKDKIVTY